MVLGVQQAQALAFLRLMGEREQMVVNFTATSSFYIPGTGGSPGGGLGVGSLGNPNLGNTTAAAVTGTGYGAGAIE